MLLLRLLLLCCHCSLNFNEYVVANEPSVAPQELELPLLRPIQDFWRWVNFAVAGATAADDKFFKEDVEHLL